MVRLSCPTAAITAAAIGLLSAPSAAAQEGGGRGPPTLFGWSLSNARLGLHVGPDYMGSDDYRVGPSGAVNLSHGVAEPTFVAPDDGVRLGLVRGKTLSAGLSSRARPGRDNNHDLRGFDKIDWAVEAGGFVNWWPADWLRLRGEVRHGIGGHHSWVADLGADVIYGRPSWVVSVGSRLLLADDKFTRTYFRVTPLEAARSPFAIPPYAPEGAFSSAGLLATAEYRLSRRWSVTADANYSRLMGDAADSPIVVDLGSRDQFSASLGMRYTFER